MRRGVTDLVLAVLVLAIALAVPARAASVEEAADTLLDQGQAERAVTLLEVLARDRPQDAGVFSRLAVAYSRASRNSDAMATARRALVANPCESRAHLLLARLGIPKQEGRCEVDPDSTRYHLSVALQCDSTSAEAWSMTAESADETGDAQTRSLSLRRLVALGFWSPALLAYGRWLLADTPQDALLVSSSKEIVDLCMAIQAAEGMRPDVLPVAEARLGSEEYRRRLTRENGLEFARSIRWPPPLRFDETPAETRQVEDWAKAIAAGRASRPLAMPCAAPVTGIDIGRFLERRAACWAVEAKPRRAADPPAGTGSRVMPAWVDTTALRTGLQSLDAARLAPPLGRQQGIRDDPTLAGGIRAQYLASAILLDESMAAHGSATSGFVSGVRDLFASVDQDTAAHRWIERVRTEFDSLARQPTDWFVNGPSHLMGVGASETGGYIYVGKLPEAVLKISPEYPDAARNNGIDGTVLVKALVGKDGRVKEVCVEESVPALDGAALQAVRQWVFKPAQNGYEPVAVWVVVPVKFTLR